MTEDLYPLTFQPALKEKVWGGHKLAPMVGLPASDKPIGEAWLIYEDLAVSNGPYAGRTLAEMVQAFPRQIMGSRNSAHTRFPLLLKFLDPAEWLSVQNHPDDAYAQKHEGAAFGKCEAWLVLQTDPGAKIIQGLMRSMTRDELLGAMKANSLQHYCDRVSVAPGDVVINTPGMIHALGPGVVIYELQQSSDVTYRLYDWDRSPAPGEAPRALHLKQGADVADLEPVEKHKIDRIILDQPEGQRELLVACRYFAAEQIHLRQPLKEQPRGESFHLVTILSGRCRIEAGNWGGEVAAGQSVLVPAVVNQYRIIPIGQTSLIRAWVPDLTKDIVEPLRARGVPSSQIAQLGGDLRRSNLRWLV